MRFQRERAQDVFDEIMPLAQKHWEEISHYKDIPLEPDKEMYFKIEDTGSLRVYTCRDDDNSLIGYAVFFLKHNLHYKSSFQAAQDLIFVHPDRRGCGRPFIKWIEETLKAEGVQIIYQHLKLATPHTIEFFKKIGYEPVDLIVAKRLDLEDKSWPSSPQ